MIERWLPIEEWPRVESLFVDNGTTLPNRDLSRIRVVEDDGKIVALLVLQYQPHAEPIWIDEDYRGKVWWPKLLAAVEAECPSGVWVFAPNARIAGMAVSQGLVRVPWDVYHRQEQA